MGGASSDLAVFVVAGDVDLVAMATGMDWTRGEGAMVWVMVSNMLDDLCVSRRKCVWLVEILEVIYTTLIMCHCGSHSAYSESDLDSITGCGKVKCSGNIQKNKVCQGINVKTRL